MGFTIRMLISRSNGICLGDCGNGKLLASQHGNSVGVDLTHVADLSATISLLI